MERKKPMARGGPMARGSAQLARTPFPRAASPTRTPRAPVKRAAAPKKARTRTGATVDTRAVVIARDGGSCVRCGQPASDLDHRRGRGAGGTKGDLSATINGAAWLLTLCGQGNTSGCHGWKENNRHESERDGYRLSRNGIHRDAETVPVRTRAGWVRFLNDGTYVRCAAPVDEDARNAA